MDQGKEKPLLWFFIKCGEEEGQRAARSTWTQHSLFWLYCSNYTDSSLMLLSFIHHYTFIRWNHLSINLLHVTSHKILMRLLLLLLSRLLIPKRKLLWLLHLTPSGFWVCFEEPGIDVWITHREKREIYKGVGYWQKLRLFSSISILRYFANH